MKKNAFFLSVFISALILGCTSGDDSSAENFVAGTWTSPSGEYWTLSLTPGGVFNLSCFCKTLTGEYWGYVDGGASGSIELIGDDENETRIELRYEKFGGNERLYVEGVCPEEGDFKKLLGKQFVRRI